MQNLPSGHKALLQAYLSLTTKGIRHWALIPILINVLIFSIAMYYLAGFATMLEAMYLGFVENYLAGIWLIGELFTWIAVIIQPLILISVSILFFYFFSSITQLLSSPFSAMLSESVENTFDLDAAGNENSLSFLSALKRTFPREIYKLYKSLKWLALMLILMFVPVANLLVPIIGAWLLAIDYLDIPADNRGLTFKQSLKQIQKHPMRHLIFGFSVYLACLIPLVNFLVVPAATIAGTLLWHRSRNENPA